MGHSPAPLRAHDAVTQRKVSRNRRQDWAFLKHALEKRPRKHTARDGIRVHFRNQMEGRKRGALVCEETWDLVKHLLNYN